MRHSLLAVRMKFTTTIWTTGCQQQFQDPFLHPHFAALELCLQTLLEDFQWCSMGWMKRNKQCQETENFIQRNWNAWIVYLLTWNNFVVMWFQRVKHSKIKPLLFLPHMWRPGQQDYMDHSALIYIYIINKVSYHHLNTMLTYGLFLWPKTVFEWNVYIYPSF